MDVTTCVCLCFDKPVLIEKTGDLITISEDSDWHTTVCHSLFCLQLKIYALRHTEQDTKSELQRHTSREEKGKGEGRRDALLRPRWCEIEKHSLIISWWHFNSGLHDTGLCSHCVLLLVVS